MEKYNVLYHEIIKPFLLWAAEYKIQTFSDIIGDIGFVILLPFIFACAIKYLMKGE
jgi:hypothetical protein